MKRPSMPMLLSATATLLWGGTCTALVPFHARPIAVGPCPSSTYQVARRPLGRDPTTPCSKRVHKFRVYTTATANIDEETEPSTTSAMETASNTSNDTSSSLSLSYPPTPSLRECLGFALPALGIYTCPPLMSLIDAAFIGRLSSSAELAALGPASSLSDSASLPLLFLSIAATNLVAKSFAQHDTNALARISKTALTMGTVGGSVLAMLLYRYASFLSVLYCGPQAAQLASYCTDYVAIRALALPFVVVTTIAQAICIGTKDTKTPMLSVALAGGFNLLGDLILVGWLGQGIAGAAWATALSQVVAAGLLMRVLKKRGLLQRQPQLQQEPQSDRFETAKQLLSFLPFLFVMAVKIGWHNSSAATAASLGGARAAAHTALFSVAMLCFTFGDVGSSLSQAFLPAFVQKTTTKPSNVSAAVTGFKKNKELFDLTAAMPTIRQLLKCTLLISTTVVTLSSVIIGIFGGQITADPAVLMEMKKALPLLATALSLHGTAVSLEGLLLSQKKLRALSVFYSILAVTIVACQVLTRKWGLGLAGVWGCYIWVSGSRVITFAALGGLLRPRQQWNRLRHGLRYGWANSSQQAPSI